MPRRVAGSVLLLIAACGPGGRTSGGGDADASPPRADAGPPGDLCHVGADDNALPDCTQQAPPMSFDPEIQWTWPGTNGDVYSFVTPLVGNLTDDNGDGEINLCDIPDVVVVASASMAGNPGSPGRCYVLDGATGTLHHALATDVDESVTPALGDIDGDGMMEIVTVTPDGFVTAFEHDGTLKWVSTTAQWTVTAATPYRAFGHAIALADIDEDGDVEILSGGMVVDHTGQLLWTTSSAPGLWSANVLADLDGQPGLEIVTGNAAYHADGSPYYAVPGLETGFPQVANLDADPQPEILVTTQQGLTLLEHDGTVVYQDLRPTGVDAGANAWIRPAVIHDMDGDGDAEFAVSSATYYTVYRPDASIVWSSPVYDESGIAGGTAFDFLGDHSAEAMYADEKNLFIFGGSGQVLLSTPRSSGTVTEYPVVADIDNDGSAEIVVVSGYYWGAPASPLVQVVRDREDRWIQARRIWNQHTYHVTNVREDGTIPQHEVPSWTRLNTFRSNAQIDGAGVCVPPID
jgi:hypothetical protein